MRVCGCEISAEEVRLALVELNGKRNVELLRIKTARIELKDDTSEADLRLFLGLLTNSPKKTK
jgi:hypothetical protein